MPKVENIHIKIYEAVRDPERLGMSEPHTCQTTHCRAGWAVHLAGEAGYALEKFYNWELAAMLIFRESSPLRVSPVRFYDSDADALADIKRMAEADQDLRSAPPNLDPFSRETEFR